MAVADAAPGIDHDQRIINMDARALKAVIHDEEITALRQKHPCTSRPISTDGHQSSTRQKQRLVTNMACAVMFRINQMRRTGNRTAMTTRQNAGGQPHDPRLPGKGDCHRRLAGTTNCQIADTQNRCGDFFPRRIAQSSCGNRTIKA